MVKFLKKWENNNLANAFSLCRRNFVKLNVFYRDLNFETLAVEPDYTVCEKF